MQLFKNKKVAAWGLAGLLLVTSLPTTVWADVNQDVQQADQMKSQLNDLKTQQDATLDQIQQLESQINDTMTKSSQLQKDIATTQKSLAEQQVKLNKRVKAMYESGDVSFWSVLLDATDFNDFIDRFSMLTMIVSSDKEMVDQYQATMTQLQQQKADLDAQQKSRQAKQQELQALEKANADKYQALQDQLDAQNAKIAGEQGGEAASYASLQGAWQNVPTTLPDVGSGTYIWPMPSSYNVTSGYGPRPGEFHKGIDIGAPIGTPIVAVADGTVIMAGPAEGFGHWVVIEHSNGLLSVYGHMFANELKVSAGQHVKQGQVIALSGEDGEATGPHLHFAFATGISGGRLNYVNPMAYLQ
ncbi:MAG: murein hydrolase activator EnvC family protein [Tumebacillaceae bacterium]